MWRVDARGEIADQDGSTARAGWVEAGRSCDASGHGEGEIQVETETVTIADSGICTAGNFSASFDYIIQAYGAEPNDYLTATATTPGGDTSAFARCIRILAVDVNFADGFERLVGTPERCTLKNAFP